MQVQDIGVERFEAEIRNINYELLDEVREFISIWL